MKFIFFILCLLLLFYNFESILIQRNHIIIVWNVTKDKHLLHILPHNVHILVDGNHFYLYLENENEETYVPAINLHTNYKTQIVNYMYLREWSSPKIVSYDDQLTDVVDIINSV